MLSNTATPIFMPRHQDFHVTWCNDVVISLHPLFDMKFWPAFVYSQILPPFVGIASGGRRAIRGVDRRSTHLVVPHLRYPIPLKSWQLKHRVHSVQWWPQSTVWFSITEQVKDFANSKQCNPLLLQSCAAVSWLKSLRCTNPVHKISHSTTERSIESKQVTAINFKGPRIHLIPTSGRRTSLSYCLTVLCNDVS